MNKKLIFVAAMLLPLSLVACKGKKDHSFEDNLSFKEEINGLERDELIQKINDKLSSVNGVTLTMNVEEDSGLQKVVTELKMSQKYYSNYYVASEYTAKTVTTSGGLTVSKEEKETHAKFISEDNQFFCELQESEKEGQWWDTYTYLDTEEKLANRQKSFYPEDQGAGDLLGGQAYKDGKGYAFVLSSVNETYEAVPYENDTKVEHVRTEMQTITKVNAKFEITKLTAYTATYSNYVEDTYEFLDEMYRSRYSYGEYSFSRGKRKAGNFSKYSEQLNKPVLGYIDYDLKLGSVAEDGTFTPSSVVSLEVTPKPLGLGKAHYSFMAKFKATEAQNAFVIIVNSANAYPNAKRVAEEKVESELKIDVSGLVDKVPGLSANAAAAAAGNQVINALPQSYSIRVGFDAEVGADSKITVSNVTFSRSYPYEAAI